MNYKITWWSIAGEQSMCGTKEEIQSKADSLDNCDILYQISVEGENCSG